MNKEELKKYYQDKEVTEGYDEQRMGTIYRRWKRRKETEIFLKLLDKKKNDKVLELGCSSGHLTQHLGKVTAIDTSKEMLKIAKMKNPKARVMEADMFELPFKNGSFNKIVTMRVWNHLNKTELGCAIHEVRRVLVKKGALIFDVEEKNLIRVIVNFFYKKLFGIKGFKIYQYSFDEIEEFLEEDGFVIERAFELEHRVGRQIVIKARKI